MQEKKPNGCRYPDLFSPIIIGKTRIKNRVVSSPHSGGPNLYRAGDDGYSNFTETAAQYFGNIARGGAGIVNTGHLGVDPRYYLGSNCEMFNFFSKDHLHEHSLPVMHMMTDLIHAYGAVASFELNHCGPHGTPVNGGKLLGPMAMTMPNGFDVKAMDKSDMEQIADYFANAAYIGKRGGFDMINIHAGHSWLIGCFFSTINNKREDEFGGNWENRARFPRMVMERVREAVGPDMLIEMRFSVSESIPGGITLDEASKTIEMFSDIVDVVQCSVGKIHNLLAGGFLFPMPYMEHGCNAGWAKEMKARLGGKVVIETVGGINEPEMADAFVREGYTDLVGMARSFIADPDWAEKARRGCPEDIRPCIRCLRCLNYANPPQTGTSICTVNPRRIMPHPLPQPEYPAKQNKNVAVIGGGPAGMMAALELANKGHNVTLYEKGPALGGRLAFADHVVFKEDVKRYRDYLAAQMEKHASIHVELNTDATPAFIASKKFDAVVVAIGAEKLIPNIPGANGKNVLHAVDMFGHEEELGEKVAIIGGGFVGCEACVHLQTKGKKVNIVEMANELMAESKDIEEERFFTLYYMTHEFDIHRRTFEDVKETDAVKVHLSAKCVEITDKGVYVEKDGKREFIEADTVVMSTGFRPNRALVEAYEGAAADVIDIGDCNRVGDLRNTSSGGYNAALRI